MKKTLTRRKTAVAIAASSAVSAGALALITVNYQFVEPTDSAGNDIPVGSVGILTASTLNADFGSGADLSGLVLSQGQTFAGDDVILSVFQANDLGGGLTGFNGSFQIDPSSVPNLTEGDQLQIYWFPENTTPGSAVGASESYGTFRTDAIVSGSTSGYFLPGDGSTINLNANTVSAGGDVADNDLQAVFTVPEPGVVSLLALPLLLALRRRR